MKYLQLVIILLLTISSVSALEVVQVDPNTNPLQETQDFWSQINWGLIWGVATPFLIAAIGIIAFVWFMTWLLRKAGEKRRASTVDELKKFQLDYKACKINSNKHYRRRNPATLWFTWKRSKILAETSDRKEFLGWYDGETFKKEGQGFFIVAVMQKVGFLKTETDLVIMPSKFKKQIIRFNLDKTVTMLCEGLDETNSSDFYSIPLIIDKSAKEKHFIDYSDELFQNYFQPYFLREQIRTNLEVYGKNVAKAAEMNATVPMHRKVDKLSERH